MDDTLKQRVVGLCILVFLAVVFIPFIFDGKGLKQGQTVQGEILELPNQTRTGDGEQYTTVLKLDRSPEDKPQSITRLDARTSSTLKPLPQTNHASTTPPVKPKPLPQTKPVTKPTAKPQVKPKPTTKPAQPKPVVKPNKPSVKRVKTAQSKSGWLVQVGGFSSKSNATALKKKLEQQGFTVRINTNDKADFFRVRVGVYSSKDKALAAREKIAKLHKVTPILVKKP